MAVLTWTWTRAGPLPERLFVLSGDGSLVFLASASTVGRYRCEAREGGATEVVARFVVRQVLAPRAFLSDRGSEETQEVLTEEPSPGPGPVDSGTESPDAGPTTDQELQENFTENRLSEAPARPDGSDDGMDLDPTSRQNQRSGLGPPHEPRGGKTYYREMVVVSLLLATSVLVLVLGSVHVWRQKKNGSGCDRPVSLEDCSKTSVEICPLSTAEDPGLGLTVTP